MADGMDPVKIVLVTGYLGAGKTTLLNHVLANDRDLRAAVIVNDIGEVNIDADLIAASDGVQAESVVPLTNGCICCTLADDLAAQLGELVDSGKYGYIVIEASGICEPMPIAYTIAEFCQARVDGGLSAVRLDNVVAVVDCARMIDEFQGGKRLAADAYEEDDVEALLVQQLEFCSTVVLNKTDLVTAEQLSEVRVLVRSLQKDAVMVEAVEGRAPLDQLLDTGRFDFDTVYQSAAWLETMKHAGHHHAHEGEAECGCGHDHGHDHAHHHGHGESHEVLEYGISTFVYERDVPFSTEAFAGFAANWPQSVIRTKGFAWLDQYPDTQFILEQAGAQKKFTDNGPFGQQEPQTKLVFIGRDMDRQAIESQLDACLAR